MPRSQAPCRTSGRRRWHSVSLLRRVQTVRLETGGAAGRKGLQISRALHTGAILGHDAVDGGGLYAVDDVVTGAGHEVAISEDLYIGLDTSSAYCFLLR